MPAERISGRGSRALRLRLPAVEWRSLTDSFRGDLSDLEAYSLQVRTRGGSDPPLPLALGHAAERIRLALRSAVVDACLLGCSEAELSFDETVDVAWSRWLQAREQSTVWLQEARAAAGSRRSWRHPLGQAIRVQEAMREVIADDAREELLQRLGHQLADSFALPQPVPDAAPLTESRRANSA